MGVEARSALGRQDRDAGGSPHLAVQSWALRRQHHACVFWRAEGKSAATFARMAGVDWGCAATRRYVERSAPRRENRERRTMDRGGGAGRLEFRDVQHALRVTHPSKPHEGPRTTEDVHYGLASLPRSSLGLPCSQKKYWTTG